MATAFKLNPRVAVALLALVMVACSDDDNPTGGGNTDTTPPGVASMTPVDEYHFNVTFSEQVTKSSAEDEGHYILVESGTPLPLLAAPRAQADPGDTVLVALALLQSDKKTVAISTGRSTAGLSLTLSVTGVSDGHGNQINEPVTRLFTGSSDPDVTPPTIVSHSPASGATNVPVDVHATIQFSEPVTASSSNFGWYPTGDEVIPISVEYAGDMVFTLTPTFPLEHNTEYGIGVAQVTDIAGNEMIMDGWVFTTVDVADPTPPTLVSTTPSNLATNVSVNADFSMTFSEAVHVVTEWSLVPFPGAGSWISSNAGKTITFDPQAPLLANQQYSFTINSGDVEDLAGNGIEGFQMVIFSTGSSLASGSIAGTLAGDPNSATANDPVGALVLAPEGSGFYTGASGIAGSAIVGGDGTYTISRVPDGMYYPLAILDSNGDGTLDPFSGDAVGALGIDLATADESPDSVVIAGGAAATGVNFRLFDPTAISGVVRYLGAYAETQQTIFIGLFRGHFPFDPTTEEPIATTAFNWPDHHEWSLNSLEQDISDGVYFVGAFMDVNFSLTYDPATEPIGFYGESPTNPTGIAVGSGVDFPGLIITLHDPAPGLSSANRVIWPAPKHNSKFKWLHEIVSQSQMLATK